MPPNARTSTRRSSTSRRRGAGSCSAPAVPARRRCCERSPCRPPRPGSADQVVLLGLDFASRGLGALASLAQVVDVATGDDLEAVTRHLAVLFDELLRRRRLLADAHAEHLTAYNERHDPLPRIVLLVDGFGGFMSTFGDTSRGGGGMASAVPLESWIERLVTIVVDGRQVGIHTVITADRRNAVPARIHAAVGSRLIMRHADENGYNEHGISSTRAKQLDLSPGRGLWDGGADGPDRGGRPRSVGSWARAMRSPISRRCSARTCRAPSPATPSATTCRSIGCTEPTTAPQHVPLGVADITGSPVVVDLTWSNLTVAGPPRSGRSTVLDTAAAVLADTHEVWAVGPSSSPLDLRQRARRGDRQTRRTRARPRTARQPARARHGRPAAAPARRRSRSPRRPHAQPAVGPARRPRRLPHDRHDREPLDDRLHGERRCSTSPGGRGGC